MLTSPNEHVTRASELSVISRCWYSYDNDTDIKNKDKNISELSSKKLKVIYS